MSGFLEWLLVAPSWTIWFIIFLSILAIPAWWWVVEKIRKAGSKMAPNAQRMDQAQPA